MIFNSVTFAIFFVVTYAVYLLLQKHHKFQNRWLLAASCFFYGWWDWRFLFLMVFTISVDYFIANAIARTEVSKHRQFLLALSVISNLAVLGFFKYLNFFIDSFDKLLKVFGFSAQDSVLPIILPIGISFYTFQAMSYVIDVYRKQLKPADNFLDYAAYITYFPQLVAGPIERGAHLLPQILKPRVITPEGFYQGCYLIFWGLFQKMFVADNLARIVNPVFALHTAPDGLFVLIALYAFALQIYCDFAGYSDIARGLGKCMGFDIMINFNLPYFSTNPWEFWKRWHISLSTWLRDYLYIPLGGNRKGTFMTYRNLLLTMVIGGLWHGAAWKFVVWGALHGIWLSLHRLMKPWLDLMTFPKGSSAERVWFLIRLFVSFHLICLGWLFFRANSLSQALVMLQAVFANFALPADFMPWILNFIYFVMFLLAVQIYQFYKNDLLAVVKLRPVTKLILGLSAFYLFLYAEIFVNSVNLGGPREFIYFQF